MFYFHRDFWFLLLFLNFHFCKNRLYFPEITKINWQQLDYLQWKLVRKANISSYLNFLNLKDKGRETMVRTQRVQRVISLMERINWLVNEGFKSSMLEYRKTYCLLDTTIYQSSIWLSWNPFDESYYCKISDFIEDQTKTLKLVGHHELCYRLSRWVPSFFYKILTRFNG